MKRRFIFMLIGGIVLFCAVGSVLLVTGHLSPVTKQATSRSIYYCPMHPTYTSARPGDCPICNMRLVKREEVSSGNQPSAAGSQQKTHKDVCYMHNCPMAHEGKPCPMLVVAKAGERVTCPICGARVAESPPASSTKKILYWTDPMLPGYKSDKPGKSPMGMDMVPVYQEDATGSVESQQGPAGYAPILVSPQKQQLIGVTTAVATRRAMTHTIRTVGRIAYDPELYQAEEEYLQALNGWLNSQTITNPEVRTQAERLVESAKLRLKLLGLGDRLIEEMISWQGPDKRLLLADPEGRVWLYAPVYEFELPLVSIGQRVRVESQAIPGQTMEGMIQSIDAVLDPASRTARVRAVLTDPQRLLKPEMFVNASIVAELGEVLAVPEDAVFDTGTRRIVFIDQGKGLFEPRDVTVGVKADGFCEVKAGVGEGERVVTSGNFLIDSESRLKAALQGMSGGTESP